MASIMPYFWSSVTYRSYVSLYADRIYMRFLRIYTRVIYVYIRGSFTCESYIRMYEGFIYGLRPG